MADYNPMELMICVAARNLEDGATVVVGTGAPCAAAMLAQKTHSPNLTSCSRQAALPRSCPQCRSQSGIPAPSTRQSWPVPCPKSWKPASAAWWTIRSGRGADRHVREYQLHHDRQRSREAESALPGSAGPTTWHPLLEDHDDDAAGLEALHRKDKFHHVPGYLTGGNSRYEAGFRKGPAPIESSPIWRSWALKRRPSG